MKCPKCAMELDYVRGPSYLNSEQWAAISPGDYFSETCQGNGGCFGERRENGRIYFSESRIKKEHDAEAARRGWE